MLTDLSRRLAAWRSRPDRVLNAWAYFGQFGDDMFDDLGTDEACCGAADAALT